ncbi:HD domain-containing protein [Spirochaetia bacterium]|nr:HD domain-containing protein [Spirochaetia bacterium]GHV19199.1 HD domain-containing protein [Spirochaetia bacterium]
MKSPKEIAIDHKILEHIKALHLSAKVENAAKLLAEDEEIQALQEYANIVSIKRLGFNDHGPVHMRTVALNALIMLGMLRKSNIKTSLESDECGNFEDSVIAALIAAFLHDVGMSIGRQDHELHSAYISYPIVDRLLSDIYKTDLQKRIMLRSLSIECITGHMGNRTIHSLEAGILLVADGCDMKKGRARISMILSKAPRVGDIHQYSANSIEDVIFSYGNEKPIRIDVIMSSEVGLFQVEEVLLGKIGASPAKVYIELYAKVKQDEPKRYL